jgi:predicted nucleic acid-binding protein
MKLIDTDILIDLSHDLLQAEQFIENLIYMEETPAISAVTRMELVQGCRNKTELKWTIELLKEFEQIHFSESFSQKAVELIEKYRLSHGLLIPDAIIAATAISLNSELYSRNIRHFKMINEITVINPY